MATRVVEGKKPYTGGKAISIDENKVISLNLRDENNLIIYDEGDDEIYVDLQLDDEITPTDAFPIGVNVGRVIVDNGWDLPGTIISAVTTSGDNIKIFYADEGTLWIDNGTGTFKQIYFKADVDAIAEAIWNYINTNLNTKTFTLSSLSDLTTAQAIWDFFIDGGNPIIKYSSRQYFQTSYGSFLHSDSSIFASPIYHTHTSSVNIGSSVFHPYFLQFNLGQDKLVVESVQENEIYDLSRLHVLTTDTDYQTPYTPQYPGSPTTKKYVDDKITTISVTLTAIGWSSNSQTVSATGVTASNTVIVSPDPSDYSDYTGAEIYCSAQGNWTLTFTCGSTPSNDIDVNVVILN